MQHCSCNVRLGGELGAVVFRGDVTVAEIVLLRAIHGEDAIVDIKPTHMSQGVSKHEELERLRERYASSNMTKTGDRLIDQVFPGRNPDLPVSLADIGVEAEEEEPAPAVKSGGRPRKNKPAEPDPLLE